jgi:hypothetical protein
MLIYIMSYGTALSIVSLCLGTLLLLSLWTNISYAQIFKGLLPNIRYSPQKSYTVRIVSPAKGERVPIGKDLIVTGTSIKGANSSCRVFVIVNGVRPYHQATSTGYGGGSDYSTWNFVLTSKYTPIKLGQNKITAKYSCKDNPSINSFYNVNVTGTHE